MDTINFRQKLHQFIDKIEDKKAEAIYTLFEEEIEMDEWEYTEAFKAQLDDRYHHYENGGYTISAKEANEQIREMFQPGMDNK